ncbi:uncharacterized protein LOC129585264 [Paramacrobiotus metropolitanus]|uniref:uncharacterized protein LOC129585264 n=1 Tax=Paramacrobiotus metropolitanus TaxID=2943436 RepID=UPI002446154E|nr:uncharacterized protein LOC129585264 [Paramacrobiotus metropolitanus]
MEESWWMENVQRRHMYTVQWIITVKFQATFSAGLPSRTEIYVKKLKIPFRICGETCIWIMDNTLNSSSLYLLHNLQHGSGNRKARGSTDVRPDESAILAELVQSTAL